MLGQALARYGRGLSGFGPAVAALLGSGAEVRVWLGLESGSSIGQERGLVGLEREAPFATAGIDRCNCTGIAVQGIISHHLSFERDQAERFDRSLQFCTPISRYAGECQAQPCCICQDHHPRPGTLAYIAGRAQGFAINGDHISLLKEGRDFSRRALEGLIESLGIDHLEHGQEGFTRRNCALELKEVFEKDILFSPEGCHVGTGGRATKERNKGDDKRLAQAMSRAFGAGIGDVFAGGQEQMHDGDGVQEDETTESIMTSAARDAVQQVTAICDAPVRKRNLRNCLWSANGC